MPLHRAFHRHAGLMARGFTLIELMVVVTIIALGAAVASLALRDSHADALAREAERLAALLEAARVQARTAGVPVTWQPLGARQASATGAPVDFVFNGLPPTANPLPTHWLDADTRVESTAALLLGPDPIIGAQGVVLRHAQVPGQRLRVGTDGLQAFSVQALP